MSEYKKPDYTKCDNYSWSLTAKELKKQLDKVVKPVLHDDVALDCCKKLLKEDFEEGYGISSVSDHTEIREGTDKHTKEKVKVLVVTLNRFYFCNKHDLVPQDMPYREIYFRLKE